MHVRPTVFLQNPMFLDLAAATIAADNKIRLPFGAGRTSPVDTRDVAEVIVAILCDPAPHVSSIVELTGPRSEDMQAVAAEYSAALGRTIRYVDVPLDEWRDGVLSRLNLPEHVFAHLLTMAKLHAANRYDRLTHDVDRILGRLCRLTCGLAPQACSWCPWCSDFCMAGCDPEGGGSTPLGHP